MQKRAVRFVTFVIIAIKLTSILGELKWETPIKGERKIASYSFNSLVRAKDWFSQVKVDGYALLFWRFTSKLFRLRQFTLSLL